MKTQDGITFTSITWWFYRKLLFALHQVLKNKLLIGNSHIHIYKYTYRYAHKLVYGIDVWHMKMYYFFCIWTKNIFEIQIPNKNFLLYMYATKFLLHSSFLRFFVFFLFVFILFFFMYDKNFLFLLEIWMYGAALYV